MMWTINIDLTGTEAQLFDELPGRDLMIGATVRIYDASASPPFSTSGTAVVVEVGDDYIVIDEAPFTLAPGDLVALENSVNTGNTNAAAADVQDHLFQVRGDGKIGTGGATERDGTKWS